MATKHEIEKRRTKVKTLMIRGLTEKEIADKLNVSRSTIARDKRALKDKLKDNLDDEPIKEVLFEMDSYLESIAHEYWKMYYKDGQKENIKLGCLNSLKSVINDKIKLLQSLGIIREEPIKVEEELEDNNLSGARDELREEIKDEEEKN